MSKKLAKFILSLTTVVAFWSMVTPAFEFPDEQAHLGSVDYLRAQGEMPKDGKLDMTQETLQTQKYLGIFRNELGQNQYTYHPEFHVSYSDSLIGPDESAIKALNTVENRTAYVGSEAAKYPPLYYQMVGWLTSTQSTSDIVTRLFSARLATIILVPAIAYFAYLSGTQIFRSKLYARTLAFMVMLQPMFSFVSAGVNSDNLHNLWFFILIYFSLKMIKSGIKLKDLVIVAVVIGLDIYTKPQGFISIPLVSLSLLLSIIRFRSWKMLSAIVAIAILSLVFAGDQWNTYRHLLNVANQSGATFTEYLRFTANKLVAQNIVWYWGVFKWLGVVIPPIYWRVANRVVLLSMLGIAVYFFRVLKKKTQFADPYSIFFILCSSVVYALIIFWYDWQHTKINGYSLGIQARYFFPTLIPHMALLLTGILSLGWNKLSRRYLRYTLIAIFFALQLGGLYRLLSVYYDLSSLHTFITQISQYKPDILKGNWWYLWGGIYAISLIVAIRSLVAKKRA
jgi:4-amino-4-deoxy-L-arabinose transferase-like glycosyltransferase